MGASRATGTVAPRRHSEPSLELFGKNGTVRRKKAEKRKKRAHKTPVGCSAFRLWVGLHARDFPPRESPLGPHFKHKTPTLKRLPSSIKDLHSSSFFFVNPFPRLDCNSASEHLLLQED